MEKDIRFRNHISIIFENSIRTIGILLFVFVGRFVASFNEMEDVGEDGLLLVLVFLIAFGLLISWQIMIWAKTYISIQDNALVIERNTLNKKRNTIGLKNISNVNLEQNLLEMIFGTCKVKLDTNSLSTADQTDVKIVLKKKDAEAFRKNVLSHMEGEEVKIETGDSQQQFISGMDDIVSHGLFSVNLTSVIVLIAAILGIIGSMSELSLSDVEGGVAGIIFSVIVAIWGLSGFVWSIAKGFIKYIDFKIARKGDKIFLSYGLFKKVDYSIPVDKINGIRFTQTMLARLGKRYMVEVINVGIDDDETEEQSFLLPYAKKEKIQEQMQVLLPEFDGCFEIQEERQSKDIWIIWLPAVIIFLAVLGSVYMICGELFPEIRGLFLVCAGAISLLLVMRKIASYFTIGVAVNEKFMKIVDGAFGKKMLFVKYNKIQYVKTKQNVIAKKLKLQRGEIHLLASLKNQIHNLPYFEEWKLEKIKEYLNKV